MKLNDSDLSRAEIEDLIYQWIFNKKHREILADRLLDGLTYQEIAEKHYISVQSAKSIIYKAQEKLFKHF